MPGVLSGPPPPRPALPIPVTSTPVHTTEGSPEHEDGDDIVIHPSPAVTPGAHARATADTPPPGDVQPHAVALRPPNYGVAASDPPPPSDIGMPVLERGDSRRQRPRNDRLSARPKVPCALARRQAGRGIKGAGAKYANLYGGPFVCILTDPALRPTKPVTGHKRTLAGLGDVTLQSADIKAANQAVEAASLIALLPVPNIAQHSPDATERGALLGCAPSAVPEREVLAVRCAHPQVYRGCPYCRRRAC